MKHSPDLQSKLARLLISLPTATLFALQLCGCSADAPRAGLESSAAQSVARMLPAPISLRSVSVQDIVQSGLDRIDFHPQVQQKNSTLVLEPADVSGFEWGIWAFGPLADQPQQLQVSLSQSGPSSTPAFIFLANFQRGSWDLALRQEVSILGTLSAAIDPQVHLSQDGLILAAVAMGSSQGVIGVHELRLRTDGDPVLEAQLTADVLQGEVPLQVQFDASASTGNIVKFEWDTSGSGNFATDTGTVPTLGTSYSSPGLFNAAVRVTDDTGSTSTDSIQIAVTQDGNLPPTASLVPDVFEGDGEAGFTVNLIAEASEDPDGTLSLFEWDLDADTSTGTNGFEVSSGTPDNQQVQISSAGEHRLRLRVTDNGGLQNVVSVIITGHGWVQVPLESFPGGSAATGMALSKVGKGPVVSYVDSSTNLLQFARSSSEHGAEADDWTLTDITVADDTKPTDILLVEDRPAICFSGVDDSLTYTRSNSASGANQTDWEIAIVDSVDALGMSMALVDGRPAISYVERSNLGIVALKFAFSSTGTGILAADWDAIVIKPADGQIQAFGATTALQLADGQPAIAWQSLIQSLDGKRFLSFARSTTAGGTQSADWQLTLALSECMDRPLSMHSVNGNPAIGFSSSLPVDETATFIRSSTPDGALNTDWSVVKIGASGEGGFNSRLAVINGRPLMSFSRDIAVDSQISVTLAQSSSADGALVADWLEQEQVSEPNQMQDGVTQHDLAVIDGYPALVFFDAVADDLIYAIRF